MRLVKLDAKICPVKEFILFWSAFYNEGKYPDTIYKENLRENGQLQSDNIVPLLKWKNGMPLSGDKKKIANKVISNLEEFNRFRSLGDCKDFDEFWDILSDIVGPGVWRYFLLHIAKPECYPIVDQNALRAFHFLRNGEIRKKMKVTREVYDTYRDFFFNIAKESEEEFRDVDKALMVFGQYLKSQFHPLVWVRKEAERIAED